MPEMSVLPAIIVKSVILAIAASQAAKHFGKVSILGILIAILAYQFVGTGFEWAITQNFNMAIQDFRIGLPGMIFQLIGGFLVLKSLEKA